MGMLLAKQAFYTGFHDGEGACRPSIDWVLFSALPKTVFTFVCISVIFFMNM